MEIKTFDKIDVKETLSVIYRLSVVVPNSCFLGYYGTQTEVFNNLGLIIAELYSILGLPDVTGNHPKEETLFRYSLVISRANNLIGYSREQVDNFSGDLFDKWIEQESLFVENIFKNYNPVSKTAINDDEEALGEVLF